jgi:multicomponent Na+:H+ antiporter subunit B
MNSLIFRAAARLLLPLLLLFSFIILMVGHNEPGGGFVGGLVGSAAIAMYAMAFGAPAAKRLLRDWKGRQISTLTIAGVGLAIALGSVVLGTIIGGGTVMEGWWVKLPIKFGDIEKVGTVVFFDIGVYVTVFGVVLLFLFELMEAES